jgi:hypothetical protein
VDEYESGLFLFLFYGLSALLRKHNPTASLYLEIQSTLLVIPYWLASILVIQDDLMSCKYFPGAFQKPWVMSHHLIFLSCIGRKKAAETMHLSTHTLMSSVEFLGYTDCILGLPPPCAEYEAEAYIVNKKDILDPSLLALVGRKSIIWRLQQDENRSKNLGL